MKQKHDIKISIGANLLFVAQFIISYVIYENI